MTSDRITSILESYKSGELDLGAALDAFKGFPTEDLGYAKLDTQRELRVGFPEVVYCAGKTPEQVRGIVGALLGRGCRVLATRASEAHFAALADLGGQLVLDRVSRTAHSPLAAEPASARPDSPLVAVVCAGTSDLPVAEEASVTAASCGATVLRIADVGVAGLHRLLERIGEVRKADVVVAVAGMEGALASVVSGLVDAPVIAVPTSVGYGASFGGLAALLAMLNSCASGVSVVNIDNGFGAGYQAALIARKIAAARG
jgi:pyridinium-3,5-biscarboxylic acid mononucleotide synthase